jgi:hypothetical protein
MSLYVGDRQVCSSIQTCTPDGHLHSVIYQMYWYSWVSWWWAQGCSKHIENWNKHTRKRTVHQVDYLQGTRLVCYFARQGPPLGPSWIRWFHSTSSHSFAVTSVLIFSYLRHSVQRGFLPWSYATRTLYGCVTYTWYTFIFIIALVWFCRKPWFCVCLITLKPSGHYMYHQI